MPHVFQEIIRSIIQIGLRSVLELTLNSSRETVEERRRAENAAYLLCISRIIYSEKTSNLDS